MSKAELEQIQAAFTRQASNWGANAATFVGADLADWILAQIPTNAGIEALDVAAGSGQLTLALARRVARITAFDATEAMLDQARRTAADAGITNTAFQQGNAYELPFAEASFDLVTCRFAIHHFERPDAVIAEMRRVTRPGGHVVIADMVSPDEPPLATSFNRLERVRDPSHAACLSGDDLITAMETNGLSIVSTDDRWLESAAEEWLSFAETDGQAAATARRQIFADLRGGDASGMFPSMRDEAVYIYRRIVVAVARTA